MSNKKKQRFTEEGIENIRKATSKRMVSTHQKAKRHDHLEAVIKNINEENESLRLQLKALETKTQQARSWAQQAEEDAQRFQAALSEVEREAREERRKLTRKVLRTAQELAVDVEKFRSPRFARLDNNIQFSTLGISVQTLLRKIEQLVNER